LSKLNGHSLPEALTSSRNEDQLIQCES
jgi:hypothetical protein